MIALVLILVSGTWYAKKRFKISLAVMGLGAIAFFVSSQVLEKMVHLLVLHPQKDGHMELEKADKKWLDDYLAERMKPLEMK